MSSFGGGVTVGDGGGLLGDLKIASTNIKHNGGINI
ncbi:MAG: hypothetical protein RJB24_30 [Candidatus Parcubacteria bacterium]|jgi:hypothetical protein